MKKTETRIILQPLEEKDRERFIIDNMAAFKYGACEEFGLRDEHIDGDGEIISRKTIEECIDCPENDSYRIICNGEYAGGIIVKINEDSGHNHLELFFVLPNEHSKGIGYGAWCAIEKLYPETRIWETCTPYFEKRNIHFYVNKCGFKIVEFFCEYNQAPELLQDDSGEGPDEMFRFVKEMK